MRKLIKLFISLLSLVAIVFLALYMMKKISVGSYSWRAYAFFFSIMGITATMSRISLTLANSPKVIDKNQLASLSKISKELVVATILMFPAAICQYFLTFCSGNLSKGPFYIQAKEVSLWTGVSFLSAAFYIACFAILKLLYIMLVELVNSK